MVLVVIIIILLYNRRKEQNQNENSIYISGAPNQVNEDLIKSTDNFWNCYDPNEKEMLTFDNPFINDEHQIDDPFASDFNEGV